jgi:hypothetical protein
MSENNTIHGHRVYWLERRQMDIEQEMVDIKEQQIYLENQVAELTTEAMFNQDELNNLKKQGAESKNE